MKFEELVTLSLIAITGGLLATFISFNFYRFLY